ncbi:HEC/Ndc80p family protein [Onchocerca flexuosa]|uniref:Kinetochore protein NDC80 n=1 Tax=Onchocerca flexuosa TaxID=387005 RepID=A0A238BMA9_9BILA|nr:HEC/Ndc80p family protein [Onchocerca flexuosa]
MIFFFNKIMKISYSGASNEQRYSLAMSGAPSTASKRSSSFFKSITNPSAVKDSRNLSDRHVQQQMQRKVLEYLLDTNYPQTSEKLVKNPTKAEFARMFEFIFQQLAPDFSLRKIEDEMPRLFRALGYPIQLKPSTMQTIGAAHTMPHLLGAITWLIDLIQMAAEISPQDLLLANEEGDGQRRSLAYGYTVRCYKKYCSNPQLGFVMDNYKDENNVLLQLIEEKDDIVQQEAELGAQIVTLTDEIAELNKDKGELDELQMNTKVLEEDFKKLQAFRDEQQEILNEEKKKKENLENEIQQYNIRIVDLKKKVAAKEKQLAAQSMTGEEARALRVRKEELKAQIEIANKERQNIELENDAVLSVNFKEASQLRERYRVFIRAFEDVSRTVCGTYDPFLAVLDQHSPNEPHFLELISEIEEKLNGLNSKVNGWIKNMEDELTTINQETAELKQKKAVLIENLKCIQRQVSKRSHDFTLKREDWEDERQKLSLEVDVAQNEHDSLHALRNGKLSVHEQLAETRKILQSRQIECDEAKKKIVNEVAVKFSTLVEQWEHLKNCYDQLRNFEKLLREALNNLTDDKKQLIGD